MGLKKYEQVDIMSTDVGRDFLAQVKATPEKPKTLEEARQKKADVVMLQYEAGTKAYEIALSTKAKDACVEEAMKEARKYINNVCPKAKNPYVVVARTRDNGRWGVQTYSVLAHETWA